MINEQGHQINQPVMPFGKYKGAYQVDIARSNPRYFLWMLNNTNAFPRLADSRAVGIAERQYQLTKRIRYIYDERYDDDDWDLSGDHGQW